MECSIGTPELTRLQLQVIDETGEDLFLTSCDRSRLMLQGYYKRVSAPFDGGMWLCELTDKGKEVLNG